MKLLTLLGVLLVFTSGSWAYSSKCAKGPEYWCRDASTAKECGAVRHCEQTVWRDNTKNKPSMTTRQTAEMLCNVLVQASATLLADKSIKVNSIKQYLRNDCAKLPNEDNLVQNCELAVDIYLPDILRHIQSGTESNKICPLIQGNDAASSFVPKPTVNALTSNATCILCEFIIHLVEDIASTNASEQELIKIFEDICTQMPDTLRSECKDFVDTYAPDIIALLVREVDPAKVCQLIKLCQKSANVAFLTKPNLQACGLCDYVSTYIKAGYPMENACSHFSTDNNVREQCEILVHLHKPNLCPQLPLCFEETKVEKPIDAAVNSLECSICKYVVSYVDHVIQDNRTEAAIEAALDKVCTIVPHSVNNTCYQFVQSYGPVIVQLLEYYATPEAVCEALRLCHNGTQASIPVQPTRFTEPETVPPNSAQCTLCEFIINYVEKAVGDNRSAAAVEAALEKVCDILPASVRPNCTSLVDKFGLVIALLIAKNATAAEVCNTIKLCNNGTQQIPPPMTNVESTQCTVCKFVVSYIDTIIQNNKSEAAIEAALEKVCTILPHALNGTCVQFVQTYGPILVTLLENYTSPDKVCGALGLCHNGTEVIAPEIQPTSLSPNSAQCTLCEFIINYVEKAVGDNRSAAAVEAALEKVCDILPASVRPNCTSLVDKFGLVIALLIAKNATAAEVCNTIKLCNNGTQQIPPPVSNLESTQCTVCKFVVSYIDTVIQNNKSEAAIEAALEKVCTILPHALNSTCVQFVQTYGPALVTLLENYTTPDKVCGALGLCHNGTEQIPPKEENVESTQCTVCKFVVSYIDTVIQNNKSAAAIEAALEKVCTILPHALNSTCVQFVQTYGPALVTLLENYTTPDKVCGALGLCHNGTQEVASDLLEIPKMEKASVNSVECSLCKYVVGYIDTIIQNNKSEAAIEAALEKVCTIVPHALNHSCVQFVKTYGPVLVQLLEQYTTPDQVCAALKLCTSAKTVETTSVGSPQCSLCKLVLHYLELVLINNKSEAAIEAALEKVCTIFPQDKKAECVQFIDTYGMKAVELLEKLGSPDLVCMALGLCVKTSLSEPVGSTQCTLCKYIVSYVDAVIQTNKSEAAIDAALEKVCTILPHSLKDACVQFVDTYGPVLVEYIAKYATSAEVCNALKLCQNGTQEISKPATQIAIKPVKNAVECTLCKYVLSFINTLLENNATEQEITKGLEAVCKIVPSPSRDACDKFVQTYGPILPQLIAELDDPNVVCVLLNMCPKSDNKFIEIPAVKKNKSNSLACSLCQYIVNYLDAIIQSNATEVHFEEELEKACKILPTTKIQSECKTFVDLYTTDLIKFLVEFGDPKKVCQEIGLCDK